MEGKTGNPKSPKMEQPSPQRGEASTDRRSIIHHQFSSSSASFAPHLFPPPGFSLPNHLHAIPVGIDASAAAAAAAGLGVGTGAGLTPPLAAAAMSIGIGGSNAAGGASSSSGYKRAREAAVGVTGMGMTAAAGGGGTGDHERKFENSMSCRLCGRFFLTDKSLFGHMRTHKDRAWKGALPPPVFSRDEFADKAHLLNPIITGDEEDDDDEDDDFDSDDDDSDDDEDGAAGQEEVNQPPTAPPSREWILPDLNKSPPREDGDDN